MKLSWKMSIVIGMVLIILAGCSTAQDNNGNQANDGNAPEANQDNEETVNLRMSIVAGTDEMPGWEGIVNAFNDSQDDIHVELERLPGSWDEYIQRMTTQIASGDAPDIGRLGAAFMPMFTENGYLENLYPYAEGLDLSQYYEEAFDQYMQGDEMYGVPIGIYTLSMYYNKDLFDEAGVEHPPTDWNEAWTWDDLRAASEQISSGSGAEQTYGIFMDLNPERFIPYLWTNGGDILNEDHTEATIDSPQSREALEFIEGLIRDELSPTPADTQTIPASDMFMTGNLGMLVEGQWMMPAFNEIDSFEWGVAPIAAAPGGQPATPNFVDTYVVYNGSDHVEEAWEAIQFFIEEEAENILVDNNLAGIPVLQSVAEERMEDMFNPLSPEEKEVFFQSVEFSQEMPFTSNWNEIMHEIRERLDLVGIGDLDMDQAVDEIAPAINDLLQD